MKKIKTQSVMFLQGKRLYLRPVERNDIPLLQKWINDPEVRKYLNNSFPMSLTDEEKYFERISNSSKNDVTLAVVRMKDNVLLGSVGLHKIDYINGTASTGSMYGRKSEWNKGYATEAKMILLEYAFMTLNLRKICSVAICGNIGSIKHNMNCGYKKEGIRKSHYFCEGKYHDAVMLAVFKKDWEEVLKKNSKE